MEGRDVSEEQAVVRMEIYAAAVEAGDGKMFMILAVGAGLEEKAQGE